MTGRERSAAEDVLTSLLRARSIVWYDDKTGEYVYRALGCAFHFPGHNEPEPQPQPPERKRYPK